MFDAVPVYISFDVVIEKNQSDDDLRLIIPFQSIYYKNI